MLLGDSTRLAGRKDIRTKTARIILALIPSADADSELNATLHKSLLNIVPEALTISGCASSDEWFSVLVQTAKNAAQVQSICEGVACMPGKFVPSIVHCSDKYTASGARRSWIPNSFSLQALTRALMQAQICA